VILPSVKNINARGKRVLVRVDFNVPIKNGRVEDDFRIKQTLPTINLLKKKGAKIILISHVTDGRTKSLRPMAEYLTSPLCPSPNRRGVGVRFIPGKNLDLIKRKIEKMRNGEIVILENIRNYPGEEKNDPKFAKKLAGLGDIYVNDAFSASHRKHASIVGITKYLPSYCGLLFEEELKNLQITFKPSHPFLLILGGIKFETKLGVLKKFLHIADKIFIGGALVVKALRMPIAKNPPAGGKIIFPAGDPAALDANAETLEILKREIKKAKFILWNGPLGDCENGFSKGTIELAKIIAKSNAKSIIGGGDTVAVVDRLGILKKFSFVSTAGGAMLEFLAKGTLPGIKAFD